MAARTIAIVGATGAQGGGLVRAILADRAGGLPPAHSPARRHRQGPGARRRRRRSRRGRPRRPGEPEGAFAGAYGAFCLTNFWEHFSPERELAQARNLAAAAKAAGVQHVIWSTLEDTRKWVPLDDDRMPTLQGQYKVPHFDAKGEADQFFRDAGVPTTFLLTSFYWDNLIYFGLGPQAGPGRRARHHAPDGRQEAARHRRRGHRQVRIRHSSSGAGPHRQDGRHRRRAPDRREMAAALSRALGQPVRYNTVSPEVYRGFGFPGADDLGNMFQFKRDFNATFVGARDLGFSRSLNPELQTFDEWLAAHKDQIPL